MTLRTEAQVLKSWMARRADVASRRRDGPLQAVRHRVALLEQEVPRLGVEVAALEHRLAGISTRTPMRTFAVGFARGGLIIAGAALWVVGLAAATPDARADDPFRLIAAGLLGGAVVLARYWRARS